MSGPEDCELKSLHDAVECRDLDSLESLLRGGVDPNTVDDKGMTALNKICDSIRLYDVHVAMVRALLRHKADVNIENRDDMSPLSNLFQGGNNHRLRMEIFRLLLEHGANVERVDFDRDTILHLVFRSDAWRPNVVQAVELLLPKCLIHVNARNNNGHTPLHVAVGHCIDARAIELLLRNGAKPNIVDLRGMAPINSICAEPELSAHHLQIVQLLCRYRAGLDIRNNEGYTPMMDLLRSTESHKWRLQIFKQLVDSGANARLAQTDGLNTIGHFVFRTYAQSPNVVATVEQLLKSRFDPDAQNKKGWTALHLAVVHCLSLEAIELLLKHGADPNARDKRKRTALHFVARLRARLENQKFTGHHIKLIELLCEHGADVGLRDKYGECPRVELLMGARDDESRSRLYNSFLANDYDSRVPKKYTRMLLHDMLLVEDFSSIERLAEFLLRHAGNINAEDKKGRILLHAAVNMLRADHVEFLLRNGANANKRDENGMIALNFCSMLWDAEEINVANLEKYLKILRLNVVHNARLSHWDIFGKTVLHQLIIEFSLYSLKPHTEAHSTLVWSYVQQYIELLLDNGLDVNVKDNRLRSPLDVAVSHCNLQVVRLLVEHGANLREVRFEGGFLEHEVPEALNLATTQNVLAIVELWQRKGVEIDKEQYVRLFKFLTLYRDFNVNDDRFVELFKYWYRATFRTGPTFPLCNYPYWHDIYNYGSGPVIRKFVEATIQALVVKHGDSVYLTHLRMVLYFTIELHLYLAEYGNMYMDRDTRNYLRETCNLLVPDTPEYRELHRPTRERLHAAIRQQVDLARTTIVGNDVSLLDLCASDHDDAYRLLQRCDYVTAINSADFRTNFDGIGKIGGIIRGYVTKALVRRTIERVAHESLLKLLNGRIPNLCCNDIIKFLDNTDLVSVYEASES